MSIIHHGLANAVLLYALIMGVWGFSRYFRKQGVDSSFWGSLVIAEILILVQGGFGVTMWFLSLRPERGGIHILYGIVSAISLPAVYLFTKGQDERRDMLIYSAVLLFLVGISLRAIATG